MVAELYAYTLYPWGSPLRILDCVIVRQFALYEADCAV